VLHRFVGYVREGQASLLVHRVSICISGLDERMITPKVYVSTDVYSDG